MRILKRMANLIPWPMSLLHARCSTGPRVTTTCNKTSKKGSRPTAFTSQILTLIELLQFVWTHSKLLFWFQFPSCLANLFSCRKSLLSGKRKQNWYWKGETECKGKGIYTFQRKSQWLWCLNCCWCVMALRVSKRKGGKESQMKAMR